MVKKSQLNSGQSRVCGNGIPHPNSSIPRHNWEKLNPMINACVLLWDGRVISRMAKLLGASPVSVQDWLTGKRHMPRAHFDRLVEHLKMRQERLSEALPALCAVREERTYEGRRPAGISKRYKTSNKPDDTRARSPGTNAVEL